LQKSPGDDYDDEDENLEEEDRPGHINYEDLYRKSMALHSRTGKRESDGRILKTTQD